MSLFFRSLMPKVSVVALLTGVAMCAQAAPIDGIYRSVDDKTGVSKALIQLKTLPSGEVTGKIIRIIVTKGYNPKTVCTDCPAPYTNQPIAGIQVITGMKPVSGSPGEYESGKILDPKSGKIYSCTLAMSPDGKKLKVHGYIGFAALGRTQWWYREDHPEKYTGIDAK